MINSDEPKVLEPVDAFWMRCSKCSFTGVFRKERRHCECGYGLLLIAPVTVVPKDGPYRVVDAALCREVLDLLGGLCACLPLPEPPCAYCDLRAELGASAGEGVCPW